MKARAIAALVMACAIWTSPAPAHEVRPAYLQLRETPTGELAVLWKTPMQGELRLALTPVLSGASEALTPIATRRAGNAAVQTWRLRLLEPLRGRTLSIDGLSGTLTDALVRIEFADGDTWAARLTPRAPEVRVPAVPGSSEVALSYFGLGVEHILLGIDHLLFVLALLLITRGTQRLVLTITAFTVAHSFTLALATLGFVRVPPAPVEAVIALSIVFVAAEIVRARRGESGLAARAPWIVAFTFGLLHGFGFAGALAEIGLPQGQIPLALLFFNVGVETGQLSFIAVVFAVIWPVRRANFTNPEWVGLMPPYAIGSVAMFWVLERIAAF